MAFNTSPLDADARVRFLALAPRADVSKLDNNEKALFASMLAGFTLNDSVLATAPASVSIAPIPSKVKNLFFALFDEARKVPSNAGPISSQNSSTLMYVAAAVGVVVGFAVGFALAK